MVIQVLDLEIPLLVYHGHPQVTVLELTGQQGSGVHLEEQIQQRASAGWPLYFLGLI